VEKCTDTTPLEILPSHPVPTLIGVPSMSSLHSNNSSGAELDEAVAKAVTSYCTSTTFTTALRNTVREEVEKHVPEPAASVPDLIALQKSTAELPAPVPSADLLAHQSEGARFPFAIYCNNCSASIWDAHYHCSTCDGGDFDLCTACTNKEVHCDNLKHSLNKREFKDGRIVGTETFIRRSSRICNGCACGMFSSGCPVGQTDPSSIGMDDSQAVTCEDCKDYDLCISCLRASQHGHDPGHQFVRAHENVHLSDHEAALLARGRNVRHEAICDNCDDVGISYNPPRYFTNVSVLEYPRYPAQVH
jgi:next-to-BRCA1 protein 1